MDRYQYREYLNSEEWKNKRALVLWRDKCCQHCDSEENLRVHHTTYENVGNEDLADLIALCAMCHEDEHNGKKEKCGICGRHVNVETLHSRDRETGKFLHNECIV